MTKDKSNLNGAASDSSRPSSSFVKKVDLQIFTVELRQRETTIVSRKKLVKDTNKVNNGSFSATEQLLKLNPALESLLVGEELVDQKRYLEYSCEPKCVKPFLEYQVNDHFVLELYFEPFNASFPRPNRSSSTGNDVQFLNRHLSSIMFRKKDSLEPFCLISSELTNIKAKCHDFVKLFGAETIIICDKVLGIPLMLLFANIFNWNRVKLRYYDGGSFTGDGEDQALLSGCSAGGLATIIHCVEFRGLFPRTTKVKCLSDAGSFLDLQALQN
uniref:Pectin acetylesterase n=1 Tax=Cicer arietinum TaxID=3827 RepID=A0A3Q7WXL6_CICAR|nr:uncharacterized protein LOC113784433 isoform X1 [Cicer arietinum]